MDTFCIITMSNLAVKCFEHSPRFLTGAEGGCRRGWWLGRSVQLLQLDFLADLFGLIYPKWTKNYEQCFVRTALVRPAAE